jgi:hypothetical protein
LDSELDPDPDLLVGDPDPLVEDPDPHQNAPISRKIDCNLQLNPIFVQAR